jgi:hypothetical protein
MYFFVILSFRYLLSKLNFRFILFTILLKYLILVQLSPLPHKSSHYCAYNLQYVRIEICSTYFNFNFLISNKHKQYFFLMQ